jgi:hypothetical protein
MSTNNQRDAAALQDSNAGGTKVAVTFDLDWAPNWCVDRLVDRLLDCQVKATWFVTNDLPVLARLRAYPRQFELGIHPNCLPGSTHGASEEDVLAHLKALVPEAVVMRTHGLYQSTPFLYKAATRFGIKADCSILLPNARHVEVCELKWREMSLHRVPHFFEDDIEFSRTDPDWRFDRSRLPSGCAVFDFHPVHLALNTQSPEHYDSALKMAPISQWTPEFVASRRRPGYGPEDLLNGLVDFWPEKAYTISELISGVPENA